MRLGWRRCGFRVVTLGWRLTLQTLHSSTGGFQFGPSNMNMDACRNLYGITFCDGANGYGNVREMSPSSSGWMYKDLYDFTGGSDGAGSVGIVTIDADGNLYGTTNHGGSSPGSNGLGVVWEITP